jgi:hypothetical protein
VGVRRPNPAERRQGISDPEAGWLVDRALRRAMLLVDRLAILDIPRSSEASPGPDWRDPLFTGGVDATGLGGVDA